MNLQTSETIFQIPETSINPTGKHSYQEIGSALETKLLSGHGITLIEKASKITEARLRHEFATGPIIACDFHVELIHSGDEFEWGYFKNGISNIDHHAPTAKMTRMISAGVQACMWVKEFGVASHEIPVVLNHTDCDSVISSAIVRGLLPALPIFEEIVLRADHTLEADPIADLLQALEPANNLDLSLRSLACLLQNKQLPIETAPWLKIDAQQRQIVRESFDNGRYIFNGKVALLFTDYPAESSFVVPLFPEAQIVLNAYPTENSEIWDIKARLGQKAPASLNFSMLGIFNFDRQFGGRWNAGSTSRSGGTTKSPKDYLEFISNKLS